MLLVTYPGVRVPERRYVLDVVLREFLGLSWRGQVAAAAGFTITLADAPGDPGSLCVADGLFVVPDDAWLTPASVPVPPLRRSAGDASTGLGGGLPVLHESGLPPSRDIVIDGSRIEVGLDLFGAIFFQLTRYEELALPDRDEHDRFPAPASVAWRDGWLERPVADEQTRLLARLIERLWPQLRPQQGAYRQLVSHDVDFPLHEQPSAVALGRSAAADLVRRRSPELALARGRALAARISARPERDPFFSFDFIMGESERRGLRSAFYFMPGCTDPRYDSTYRVSDPPIRRLLRRIHERGHEIGLHPSYRTFDAPEIIAAEFAALREACAELGIEQTSWGGRQHFLRWGNPVTWRAWADAGLAYDSSLGFARQPGFRCGTSHEYPVFDLVARRPLPLRERPLVFMDVACLDPEPGSPPSTAEELQLLRDRCRGHGGNFTLLWHNTRLVLRAERELYRAVLGGP